MRKRSTIHTGILLFIVSVLQVGAFPARGQERSVRPEPERHTNAADAKAFEEGLKLNPDNLTAREWLISYYFQAALRSKEPDLEERREEHVLWLIEYHPESQLAGSPEAGILDLGSPKTSAAYQRGKQLWLEQVAKHPDSAQILRNAAMFLLLEDRATARELLEKASLLNPSDSFVSSMLAQTYGLERMLAKSPAEKIALAQKSLAIRERALEKASPDDRFDQLVDIANDAFEADDTEKAEQYASELLQLAPQSKDHWNYGNAVHKGNLVMGRIALRRGDIPAAKRHLLAAGETPGSPQLDSFGPNMTLAKELLEKGEREVVLTYLESCAKFWKMGGDQLRSWTATIKGGGIPDFGANLLY